MIQRVMHLAARRGGLHVLGVYYRKLGAAAGVFSGDLRVRALRESELLACCADPELELGESIVRSGNTCIGAFSGDVLAGYAWFAYDDAPHVNGVRVRVPGHAIYRFKTFVRPAWRGRGIAPFLYRAADELVARPGRAYVANCIALQNAPSIAASLRSGDAPLGRLGYWQSGKRFLALHSAGVALFGLRFYLGK